MKAKRKTKSKTKKSAKRSGAHFSAHFKKFYNLSLYKTFHKTWNKFFKQHWKWAAIPACAFVLTCAYYFAAGTPAPTEVAFAPPVVSAKVATLFDAANKKATLGERIAFWADALTVKPDLLYTTYGNGPKIDDYAPIFVGQFDCTTFVETVAALSKSTNPNDVVKNIIAIRYKYGQVGYQSRNHFPEADWIPNNAAAGNLKDITAEIAKKAGVQVAVATKKIDKVAWFKSQKNPYAARYVASSSAPNETTAEVTYIPMDKLNKVIMSLPQGAVINIVREDRTTQPVMITHQGFLIWRDKKAYFHHVTREKEVTEVRFYEYMNTMKKLPWKVLGINVNQFQG